MNPILITVVHSTYVYEYSSAEEASHHLSRFPAEIRLDLHGVLDILPDDCPISKTASVVCISYVTEKTKQEALEEIQMRIHSGQILYGVLVFKRGRGAEKYRYVEEGSKAWVNQQIPFCDRAQTLRGCDYVATRKSDRALFVDDSTDHLRSTRLLVPEIQCVLFNTGIPTQLLKILSDWGKLTINDPLHQ